MANYWQTKKNANLTQYVNHKVKIQKRNNSNSDTTLAEQKPAGRLK